eukprot:scaffold6671_cov286-Chaetoceros_neogracile.AAC.13
MSFPSSIPPSRTEEDKERIQQTVIQHKNANFLSDDSVLLPKTGKVVEETSSIYSLQEQIMPRCKMQV